MWEIVPLWISWNLSTKRFKIKTVENAEYSTQGKKRQSKIMEMKNKENESINDDNLYWGCQLHLNQQFTGGSSETKITIKNKNYLRAENWKKLHDKSFKKW